MKKFIRHPITLLVIFGVSAIAIGTGSNMFQYYARALPMHHTTSPIERIINLAFVNIINLLPYGEKGLAQIQIYLSEKAQMKLLSDVPKTTKQWQSGKLTYPDGQMHSVKIRHRGDNPRNFLDIKKSWRIKTKKKKMFQNQRVVDLVAPRNHVLDEIIPFRISEMLGLLTPDVSLAELFINDKSHGVMLNIQRPDESLLRSKNVMPANIYNGPGSQNELFSGVGYYDLFQSPNSWSKGAIINAQVKGDKSDLNSFLLLLSRAEFDSGAMKQLRKMAPIDVWARFGALQILTQSWHNSQNNNQRLLFDQWRGQVIPIVWDTGYLYDWQSSPRPKIDYDSHTLFTLYLRCSDFLATEYRLVHSALTELGIMSVIARELREQETELSNSLARDAAYQSFAMALNGIGFGTDAGKQDRNKIINSLNVLSQKLITEIGAAPKVGWRQTNGSFVLVINDIQPAGSITLTPGSHQIMPRRVILDRDSDGRITQADKEIPFRVSNGQMVLDGLWFANRVPRTRKGSLPPKFNAVMIGHGMATQPTRFALLFEPPTKIEQVSSANPFSGIRVKSRTILQTGMLPTNCNAPVLNDQQPDTALWQGNIMINNDTLVEDPVVVKPGTIISISPGASLVFFNRLKIEGTKRNPVIIQRGGDQPWGTVALNGMKTAGSEIRNLRLQGGSGGFLDQVRYTGMFSIHDTRDIQIDGLSIRENAKFDDVVHIVYSKNVTLSNLEIEGAFSDAIDIDMSEVSVKRADIKHSGGDAIDLMDSRVNLIDVTILNAGDKGISVGEASDAVAFNLRIQKSDIGIESKDKASIAVYNADLVDNRVQLNAYTKNWRYSGGGSITIGRSFFSGISNVMTANNKSVIKIENSTITSAITAIGPVSLASDVEIGLSRISGEQKFSAGVLSRISGVQLDSFKHYRGMIN